MQERLDELNNRFRILITGTCNVVGCGKCGLEFDGGCASTILQDEIMEVEDCVNASNYRRDKRQ